MNDELNSEQTPETPAPEDNSADFASMLAEDDARRDDAVAEPKGGDQVKGKIVQIGPNDAFVDYGGRGELPIFVADLMNADGELAVKVGDEITAYATGKGSDLRLAMKQKLSGKDPRPLEEAFESGVPLQGKVSESNKGGFVVNIGGWRAFCPISQIDDRFVEDPAIWIGKDLEFRVIEFADNGQRLVVSRRVILQETKEKLAEETRKRLHTGSIFEGRVVRILPFGAFIDIGGVEGLVHVSELTHSRVAHPSDAVEEGQTVEVKIIDIRNLGMGKEERISLSMKALAGNPWENVRDRFKEGEWIEGAIIGLTPFGAFVELEPGLTGLIHISALSSDRIDHPSDIVKEGQHVSVRIIEIDEERQRISLSITS
jgi:small subunit ribosomal protein S1